MYPEKSYLEFELKLKQLSKLQLSIRYNNNIRNHITLILKKDNGKIFWNAPGDVMRQSKYLNELLNLNCSVLLAFLVYC